MGTMWNEIQPGLWLGDTPDDEWLGGPVAWDHGWVERDGRPFDAVVTLFGLAEPFGWEVEELRYGFADGPVDDLDLDAVRRCAAWAHERWHEGKRVLVRCQAGWNRSGLVMALVLVMAGWEPAAAVALLREKRSPNVLCNRDFEHWVVQHGETAVEHASV